MESLGILCEKYPNLEHLVVTACGRMSADEGTRAIKGLAKLKHAIDQTSGLGIPSSRPTLPIGMMFLSEVLRGT
jgi:hypothetical protein